jgi:TPR repeat protein
MKNVKALCAQAMVLFQAAAQQGAPMGLVWQAYLHLWGLGVPQNTAAARKLYEAGASTGDGAACYNLGMLLMGGVSGVLP